MLNCLTLAVNKASGQSCFFTLVANVAVWQHQFLKAGYTVANDAILIKHILCLVY